MAFKHPRGTMVKTSKKKKKKKEKRNTQTLIALSTYVG